MIFMNGDFGSHSFFVVDATPTGVDITKLIAYNRGIGWANTSNR